ncbi:MAG: guanylate kinase [Gemmatimonadales bacterium]|jgi:guanylate kinase
MKSFAIVISAPSGVGKTTVARKLVEASAQLMFSVSATTREPRPAERPGIDYYFVSRADFEAMIENGELLEWAEVHGELYGTPSANLEEAERAGRLLILDIDVQGARQIGGKRPDSVTIFLLPPSFEALMQRLRVRGSEGPEDLRRRLSTAKAELAGIDAFRYVVVNDQLDETLREIRAIITAESRRLDRQDGGARALSRDLRAALEEWDE